MTVMNQCFSGSTLRVKGTACRRVSLGDIYQIECCNFQPSRKRCSEHAAYDDLMISSLTTTTP